VLLNLLDLVFVDCVVEDVLDEFSFCVDVESLEVGDLVCLSD